MFSVHVGTVGLTISDHVRQVRYWLFAACMLEMLFATS